MKRWTPVKDRHGKVMGHVRRISGAFEPELWEVREPRVTFEDAKDAMDFLLEQVGVLYQVKTELSHRYYAVTKWTGAMDRDGGTLFARQADAQRVADSYSDRKGWDRVCVVPWEKANWA